MRACNFILAAGGLLALASSATMTDARPAFSLFTKTPAVVNANDVTALTTWMNYGTVNLKMVNDDIYKAAVVKDPSGIKVQNLWVTFRLQAIVGQSFPQTRGPQLLACTKDKKSFSTLQTTKSAALPATSFTPPTPITQTWGIAGIAGSAPFSCLHVSYTTSPIASSNPVSQQGAIPRPASMSFMPPPPPMLSTAPQNLLLASALNPASLQSASRFQSLSPNPGTSQSNQPFQQFGGTIQPNQQFMSMPQPNQQFMSMPQPGQQFVGTSQFQPKPLPPTPNF